MCQAIAWVIHSGVLANSRRQSGTPKSPSKIDGRTKEGKQAAATRLAKERARFRAVAARRKAERAARRQAAAGEAVIRAIEQRAADYQAWRRAFYGDARPQYLTTSHPPHTQRDEHDTREDEGEQD
jgi:hypothetical protein